MSRLKGLHPDLVRVVLRAITLSTIDFGVLEAVRSPEKQRENIAKGVSWTMNSRHLVGANSVCHAVDLGAYIGSTLSWDMKDYHPVAEAMKEAARIEGVWIEWGFDLWGKDGPHFQLPWDTYPKDTPVTT